MMILLITLCFSFAYSATCEAMKPIVFVPGIIASMLEGEANIAADAVTDLPEKCSLTYKYSRWWVALKDVNPLVNECILGYITPMWDSANKQQIDIPGVNIVVPDFGSTYACDQIDPNFPVSLFAEVFHELIKKFEKVGYVDGDNMLGAAYDWRYYRFNEYAHKENWYENTKNLIKKAYDTHGKKVVIISHSMGGLMTYRFLHYVGQSFADQYIDNWVAMSAPFLGATKAVAAAIPGHNLDIPINAKKFRTVARKCETVALLFPVGGTSMWGSNTVLTISDTGKTYNADQLTSLVDTVGDSDMSENFKYVMSHGMLELYKKYNNKLPVSITLHCLVTTGVETINHVSIASDYDQEPTYGYGDGDGTVDIQSLEFCKTLGAATYEDLGKHSHTGILDASVSYDAVAKYVCN